MHAPVACSEAILRTKETLHEAGLTYLLEGRSAVLDRNTGIAFCVHAFRVALSDQLGRFANHFGMAMGAGGDCGIAAGELARVDYARHSRREPSWPATVLDHPAVPLAAVARRKGAVYIGVRLCAVRAGAVPAVTRGWIAPSVTHRRRVLQHAYGDRDCGPANGLPGRSHEQLWEDTTRRAGPDLVCRRRCVSELHRTDIRQHRFSYRTELCCGGQRLCCCLAYSILTPIDIGLVGVARGAVRHLRCYGAGGAGGVGGEGRLSGACGRNGAAPFTKTNWRHHFHHDIRHGRPARGHSWLSHRSDRN